jgi:PEP-CTERM motif
MSVARHSVLSGFGSGLLAAAVCSVAWPAPAPVTPGASDVPIPTFTGSTPTVTLLFDTGPQSAMMGGITVDFEEVAVHTSLNTAGVSFGFMISASNVPTSLGATLPGFGGFMTAVESCDPLTSGSTVCGTATGTVSRSSGTGDVLTFAALGTTPVMVPSGPSINASNVYGIFTDAAGFMHPTTVTVTDDGTSFSFKGIGASSSTGVPEPATLTLLGLGLLWIGVARRRRA